MSDWSKVLLRHSYKLFEWAPLQMSQKWTFAPSFLSFLENDFALLWYKTLHSEVVWTKENAGKSGFTLFAAWLITLPKVLWYQNTKKNCINEQAKQGRSFTSCAFSQNGEWRFLLSFHIVKVTWSYNWPIISFTKYNFIILFSFTTERDLRLRTQILKMSKWAPIYWFERALIQAGADIKFLSHDEGRSFEGDVHLAQGALSDNYGSSLFKRLACFYVKNGWGL